MSIKTEPNLSPSYFWSCITLSDDCPFFTTRDPCLFYFGLGVIALYGTFLLLVFADLSFYWSLDKLHDQADYYVNLVRTKLRRVQSDQHRLVTTQEITEKELKKCQDCKNMIVVLREALNDGDPYKFAMLTSSIMDNQIAQSEADTDISSAIDF